MSEENIQELMDYNLEYMEAQQSEEIFGGDYTSAVDLKYANKQIEKLEKAMEGKSSYKDIIIENQQKKIDKQKEVLDKIKEYCKSKIEEQKNMTDFSKYYLENYDKVINTQHLSHSGVMLETIKSTTIKRYEDILELLEEIE